MRKVLPRVERESGRPFLEPPRVHLVSLTGLSAALERKFAHDQPMPEEIVDSRLLDLNVRVRARFAEATSRLLIAFYSSDGRIAYVAPLRVGEIVAMAGGTERDCRDVTRVLLSHELTHALQDQYLDLDALRSTCSSPQAVEHFQTALEGHAMKVQESVARALRVSDAVADMAGHVSMGDIRSEDPEARDILPLLQAQYALVVRSKDALDRAEERCGGEEVWEVLEGGCREMPDENGPCLGDPERRRPRE